MTWRDAASVRKKFKVPATQHHHRECAERTPYFTSSVFYGLPTYKTVNNPTYFQKGVFYSGIEKDLQ